MTWMRNRAALAWLLAGLAACGQETETQLVEEPSVELGPGVALRVLIIATGSVEQDPGRALMEGVLDQVGVPYDVLDSSRETLTADRLHDGDHGFYNGVIVTEAETYLSAQETGLSGDEFAILHEYERAFGVREAVISGFPASNPALGLDYGMDVVEPGVSLIGRWTAPAGGTEYFEYINPRGALPIDEFAFRATPRSDPSGPVVTPLLVDDLAPEFALISLLHYDDGREVLLSTLGNAPSLLHSQVLAYEFLNFATRGLFLGARHVYMSLHNDDLFLADEVWNPDSNSNWPEDFYSYRMSPHDVANVVAYEADFRIRRPLFGDIGTEFAYNGAGAALDLDFTEPQTLTQAIYHYRDDLRFINHTFEALQMDRLCPDPDEPQPGQCPVTDYATAYDEIAINRAIWRALAFPGHDDNIAVLLSDSHSGLHDRNSTPEDDTDDIDFPDGANREFLRAAYDLGVRGIASDTSRVNQDTIQRIPGFDLVLLPRFPTAMFYNATTPEEDTAEFNYVHHDRYLEQGLDPCALPHAICQRFSYDDLLAHESDLAVRHMLSYRPFPHYFHQTNLRDYDGLGSTLQYDWMEATAELYEELMSLPVRSPRFHEYHAIARHWLSHRESGLQGFFEFDTGEVVVWSTSPGTANITGVPGGEVYGGQHLRVLDVSDAMQRYPVDPGTDR